MTLVVIPMRFPAYKMSGGRGVLKNAPSPGPPSHKTFKIWVDCPDCSSSASLTGIFKKCLVEGFGDASDFKNGSPRTFICLNAHWHKHLRGRARSERTNETTE